MIIKTKDVPEFVEKGIKRIRGRYRLGNFDNQLGKMQKDTNKNLLKTLDLLEGDVGDILSRARAMVGPTSKKVIADHFEFNDNVNEIGNVPTDSAVVPRRLRTTTTTNHVDKRQTTQVSINGADFNAKFGSAETFSCKGAAIPATINTKFGPTKTCLELENAEVRRIKKKR